MFVRISAAATAVFALVAFILSLLCVTAGSSRGFLDDVYLVNLNTSRIGYFEPIEIPRPSGGGLLSSLENAIANEINSLLRDIQRGISRAGNDIATVIGVHDFYTMYTRNYCEGSYEPIGLYTNATRNVTECSSPRSDFWFNPSAILQSELKGDITLKNIHWPEEIDDGLRGLKTATHALLGVLYSGIALEGLLLVTAVIVMCWPPLRFANAVIAVLAFLLVGIASGVATAVVVKGAATINDFGEETGVSATRGTKFLAMTWSAVGLLLLACVATLYTCTGRESRVVRRHNI